MDKPPAAKEKAETAAEPQKCDEACVRQNADKASAACARRIEAQSAGDFEWVTRPFTGIFQQADPSKGGDAVATYRGDSIRFMSPQREWVRVTYECGFDVEKASVVGVRVRPGRLDRPVALQAPVGAAANNGATPASNDQAGKPIASAPLAAAIMQAAKQRGADAQQKAAPSPRQRIGEPSAIDVSQVGRRRGVW